MLLFGGNANRSSQELLLTTKSIGETNIKILNNGRKCEAKRKGDQAPDMG